jgi:competence protein ComEA
VKTHWGIAMGVLFGLLGSGAVVLASSQPRGTPIQLRPPPTPAPIRVHVTGAVIQPGVYDLAVDSRIEDLIAISGGFAADADPASLNLAAQLQDGTQITVPTQRAIVVSQSETSTQTPDNPPSTPSFPININTASQEELEYLPGIGPVTAGKIIDYRQSEGNFASIEEIQKVSGIGPATFEKLSDLISVGE